MHENKIAGQSQTTYRCAGSIASHCPELRQSVIWAAKSACKGVHERVDIGKLEPHGSHLDSFTRCLIRPALGEESRQPQIARHRCWRSSDDFKMQRRPNGIA